MKTQTIEEAVEDFNYFNDQGVYPNRHNGWLTQALQAQRDATLQEVLSMKRVAHQEKEVMYAPVSVVLGEVVPAQPVDNVRPLEYVKVFDIEKLTNINPTH